MSILSIACLLACFGWGLWSAYSWNSSFSWDYTWDSIEGKEFESLFELVKNPTYTALFTIIGIGEFLWSNKKLVGCFLLGILVFCFYQSIGIEDIKLLTPTFVSLIWAIVKASFLTFVCGYLSMASLKFYRIIA